MVTIRASMHVADAGARAWVAHTLRNYLHRRGEIELPTATATRVSSAGNDVLTQWTALASALASVVVMRRLSPKRAVRIAVPDAVAMFEHWNSPRQNAGRIIREARLAASTWAWEYVSPSITGRPAGSAGEAVKV
jgi:hypothetical protein